MAEAESRLEDFKTLLRKAKNNRDRLEPNWYLNIAFYIGDQWIFWNRGRIDRPNLEPYRETIVDNRILPSVDSRVARKTKNRPKFIVTPFSGDEEDRRAAEIGEKVCDHDWLNLQIEDKHYICQKWVELTGAAFMKVYWDSAKGEKVDYIFKDDQPLIDPNTNRPIRAKGNEAVVEADESLTVKSIAEGDLCVEVISPFELYPDPLATNLEDAEWIIEEKIRSKEYVRKRYGKEVKENTSIPVGIAESRMFPAGMDSLAGIGGRYASSAEFQGVTLYEYWGRPSDKDPNGRYVVWTDEGILVDDPLDKSPYADEPYVMFAALEVPGRFWPDCVTTQMRGPQTLLNKLRSQVVENAGRIGNPALLSSRQANVEYYGTPGERIDYDSTVPDAVPSYLHPPDMPSYIYQEIERVERSITEISGIHEVSKAQVPAGVTAASAINLLQEADDTRLGPEIASMERSLAKLGTKILRLRAKNNTVERTMRVAGDEGDWDIFSFKNIMLRKNTDVEVQAGSAMPRSKAAKQAAMQEMFDRMLQYGVELDQRALRKFFKEFEIGGLEHLLAGISADEAQIRREHQRMFNGIAIDINEFDDDDFHIAAHEEAQKSARYEQADETVKQIIQVHVAAHRERRVKMINQQLIEQGIPTNGQVPENANQQV